MRTKRAAGFSFPEKLCRLLQGAMHLGMCIIILFFCPKKNPHISQFDFFIPRHFVEIVR
jgi:hypothetical protein